MLILQSVNKYLISTAYCSLTDNKWNTYSLDSSIEKTLNGRLFVNTGTMVGSSNAEILVVFCFLSSHFDNYSVSFNAYFFLNFD